MSVRDSSQPTLTPAQKAEQEAEAERQMLQLVDELNAKFSRLVRGLKTPKDLKIAAEWLGKDRELPVTSPNGMGTERYRLEVEMSHVQDEFMRGPIYLRPKLIDRMSQIIANVINKLKELRESDEPEAKVS